MSATVFAILLLARFQEAGWVVASAAVAVVALAAFIVRERQTRAPAVNLSLFRNARFVSGSLAGAGA